MDTTRRIAGAARAVRQTGCGAIDLCYLARGSVDAVYGGKPMIDNLPCGKFITPYYKLKRHKLRRVLTTTIQNRNARVKFTRYDASQVM